MSIIIRTATLIEAELDEARDWLKCCHWEDLRFNDADNVIDDLSDIQVERAIARHYEGGIQAFRDTFADV
jgi:hypothetical protein